MDGVFLGLHNGVIHLLGVGPDLDILGSGRTDLDGGDFIIFPTLERLFPVVLLAVEHGAGHQKGQTQQK